MHRISILIGGLITYLLASCGSLPDFKAYSNGLEESNLMVQEAQLEQANLKLVALVDSIRAEHEPALVRQEFAAVKLLIDLHDRASYSGAFMEEYTRSRSLADLDNTGKRISPMAHLVASTYYADKLLALASDAREGPTSLSGTELVPASLKYVDPETTSEFGRLMLAAAYSRLGFESQARTYLLGAEIVRDAIDGTRDDADARFTERLIELGLTEANRSWLFLTMHHILREESTSKNLAYRYGIRARLTGESAFKQGDLPSADYEHFQKDFNGWVLELEEMENGGGTFRASDNSAYSPRSNASRSGLPLLEFEFVPHDLDREGQR